MDVDFEEGSRIGKYAKELTVLINYNSVEKAKSKPYFHQRQGKGSSVLFRGWFTNGKQSHSASSDEVVFGVISIEFYPDYVDFDK